MVRANRGRRGTPGRSKEYRSQTGMGIMGRKYARHFRGFPSEIYVQ